MIKVLFFEFPNTYNIGGIQKFVATYVKYFSDNIKVGIVASGEKYTLPDYWKKSNVDIHIAPSKKNIVKYLKFIRSVISDYDIIHVNKNSLINIIPVWVAVGQNKKIVCHSHNTAPTVNSKLEFLHNLNKRYVIKHSDLLLACSKEAGEWMFGKDQVENGNVTLINNAIELSKYQFRGEIRKKIREELNVDSDTILFGHVGRFSKQKNHTFLISVFEEISKKVPKTKLLLMGDGPQKDEIKKEVLNKKLENKIIFGGVKGNIEDYFMAMDCFVFPSLYEGLGIAVIEAQAGGLKCYISDALPEEVRVSDLVKVISLSESAKEWCDIIVKDIDTLQHYNSEKQLKEAGYEISIEAQKLENLYVKLMKN